MKSKCYKIGIIPITPFHIGSGELHEPLSLIIKGQRAYYLKQLEYVRYLLQRNKPELEAKMALSDIKQLHQYFADCFDPQREDSYSFSYPVSKVISENYHKKMQNLRAEGYVRAFIRSGLSMQPIIPGSSIKGAIRTAILSHWQKYAPNDNPRQADRTDRELQAKILGYWNDTKRSVDIPSDPFKVIKIADADWDNERITIFEVGVTSPPAALNPRAQAMRNLSQPYKKPMKAETLPILMEIGLSNKGGTESELNIFINDPHKPGIKKILPEGAENLEPMLSMINEYYQGQFEKEESYYKRFGESEIKHYNDLKTFFKSLKPHQCMIKLGMGSGQNYCSYSVMNHSPKTRKLLNHLPMGWMKLSFEAKQ